MEPARAYENTHELYRLNTTYTTCNIVIAEFRSREVKGGGGREL